MGIVGTPRHENLMGQRFGRLTIIAETSKRTASRGMVWLCRCDCGKEKEIAALHLKQGLILSCGCLSKEINSIRNTIHGHEKGGKKSLTYCSWEKMMSRCYREKDAAFHYYGGRGVKVCESWHTFENFLKDMRERPSRYYTIERINNKGNYEPNNCKWATYKEQANNTSRNVFYTYNGERMTIAQMADKIGIKYDTMYCRLKHYGWSVQQAMNEKVKPR